MDAPRPADFGGPVIVSVVGENENGILRHLSRTLMALLEPYGFEGHILDLRRPDWASQLLALMPHGIALAWGHAGVGAALEVDGVSLWERIEVPFVSVLADPPCWMVANHAVASGFVVNAYLFREWLDVQRRFIRSRQLAALVRPGVVPNPGRDAIPWRERDLRAAFVKTGEDPDARRATWRGLPRRSRAAIEDASAAALARGTGDITPLVTEALEANGLACDGRPELLFAAMLETDRYVRAARSTAMARALLPLPVDVFGRGWDHLRARPSRARFHPAFDAANLPALYAGTQYLINTTPNFGSGLHERVLQGLDARCCVVSDENDTSRAELAAIPTFFGVDPFAPDLTGRLEAIIGSGTDHSERTGAGVDLVAASYSGERFMLSLLDLSQEVRLARRLEMFRCPS